MPRKNAKDTIRPQRAETGRFAMPGRGFQTTRKSHSLEKPAWHRGVYLCPYIPQKTLAALGKNMVVQRKITAACGKC